MAYLVDSDVLIEAKDRYYGFDFCPAFWDWLKHAQKSGQILSVERVQQELLKGHDQLAVWAKQQGHGFFEKPTNQTTQSMGHVTSVVHSMKVNGQPYQAAAIATFLADADYYLVSHAHAHSHIVVTNETGHYAGQQASIKRFKLPDVCLAAGVQSETVFQMLRNTGAQFVL